MIGMSKRLLFCAGAYAMLLATTACGGTGSNATIPPAPTAAGHGTPVPARPHDYLYAATLDWDTGSGTVYYYDAYGKKTKPLGSLSIDPGFPDGLWTDAKGDVYVAVVNAGNNGRGYVNVYTPGLSKLVTTYTTGLDGPAGGTFDAAGNMYVANLCGTAPSISCDVFAKRRGDSGSTSGYVAIYPPGSSQPASYLQAPINIAVGVAVDGAGNVFVPNNTGRIAWNVIEFKAGATQGSIVPFRKLPKQRWVGAAAFDPRGDLVVSVNSAIDFFPSERGKPAHSLTSGVLVADGLAYGPDGTLFAGNYEFKENEGNVIAFPSGASLPARTFAVPYGNGVVSVAVGATGD